MTLLAFDFERLISPISPEAFKRQHWESRPLLVSRQNPKYYEGLLSLTDVDSIFSTSSIHSRDIRVLREGQERPLGNLTTGGLTGQDSLLEAVYAQYRDGATIVLQFIHERWEPLKRLCQSLAIEFSAGFQINAYLTPPKEQGLLPHYDTHDVFVLQTEGSKHWRVYEEPFPLPLKGQPYRRDTVRPGNVMMEFDLYPGDCLYMPRGYLHDAVSIDSASLHLTVGVQSVTWASVLLEAMESVIKRDHRFRESLPFGFANDERQRQETEEHLAELLGALVEQIEPSSVVNNAIEVAARARQPNLEGHLLDLDLEPQVNLKTRLRRRPEIPWRLSVEESETRLYFHGKVIRMPDYVEPELRFITEAQEFKATDLPGELDEPGRLVLVQRLLREGFLTLHPLI